MTGRTHGGDPYDDLFVEEGSDVFGAPQHTSNRETPKLPGFWTQLRTWVSLRWSRLHADPGLGVEALFSVVVVGLCISVILLTLHPSQLWADTTPTGGDMGAHVWGPRYLLDNVLGDVRLSGWTHDWYNGFPAYKFYMVIPALMIVVLHVGLEMWAAVPVAVAGLFGATRAWSSPRLRPYRHLLLASAVVLAILVVPLPYNRAFKLVSAVGLIGMPVACWAFAKLADLPSPTPALAAAAGTLFVYNREPMFNDTGNIIGGNFHSTMAGEFAFSISLTLSILYLGVAARGLRTGRHRALAAGLFALAGLCHLIPAFFVLACTAAMFVVSPGRARLRWLCTMVPVAGLLTAWWVIPFWWRRDHVNDMGWERLPIPNADESSVWYYLIPNGLRYVMVVALLGVVASLIRRHTVGLVLAAAWVAVMVAFAWMPEYRLWNARLLPFMYLSITLLAAIGAGELIRTIGVLASGRLDRPFRPVTVVMGLVVGLGVLVHVTLPLQGVLDEPISIGGRPVSVLGRTFTPISRTSSEVRGDDGEPETATRSEMLGLFSTTEVNPVAGWSDWNYKGMEKKPAWPEYASVVSTMAELGADPAHGCGRALWEFNRTPLASYGTTMSLMLLPYWTGGCIGSQEGLYFESSTMVPHHFLMQSELSAEPSRPQRELPYPDFDIDAGVAHLQLLGVKYYIASSEEAVAAANGHPDLTEVAVSDPWHVFEVSDSPVVEVLTHEPVVATGVDGSQHGWMPVAVAWMLGDDVRDVHLAADGPSHWERVEIEPVPEDSRRLVRWIRDQVGESGPMDQVPELPRTSLPDVDVSEVELTPDGVSFRVSEVGVPVLVKVSYFPNWKVTGADGPYRVSPSLMVVVPTDHEVRLDYGRTEVDLVSAGLSILGLVGLVLLARSRPIDVPPFRPTPVARWIDRHLAIGPTPDDDSHR